MARNIQYKYDFRRDFKPDPIKHHRHVPASPLYRPGQEHNYENSPRTLNRSRLDDHQYGESLSPQKKMDFNVGPSPSPRLANELDPRFGSASNNRHNQLRQDDKAAFVSYPSRRDYREMGSPPMSRSSNYKGDLSYRNNPWSHRYYPDSSGQMIDPRVGSKVYGNPSSMGNLQNGGALLFIRFPTGSGPGKAENIAVAAQAFLRSKTVDMGGRFLGMARYVEDFGYPDGPLEAIAVYHFPSPAKALLFFQYDMIIKQPDFPPPYGHAEMWIVCNAYLPNNLDVFNTFLISEVSLHDGIDEREFFEVFQKPFQKYLSENGAMPFVVCSYGPHDRQSLRRHMYPRNAIVTCHLFQGPDHLRQLGADDHYLALRNIHNERANEKCSVFTLDKRLCP